MFTKFLVFNDTRRVIWFGDLNYRIALSYSEARKLLEENAWDALLDKDQVVYGYLLHRTYNFCMVHFDTQLG